MNFELSVAKKESKKTRVNRTLGPKQHRFYRAITLATVKIISDQGKVLYGYHLFAR